ncbi:Fc.00g041560.m01.CDS01 [Cosmosporella sp. VM-42]
MAGSTKHALPEHWTELQASRTQKERCAKEINLIKIVCAAKHRKQSMSLECPGCCRECYAKILDVMQARYCDSQVREWFTERKAFINELGVLFADAKEGKVNLEVIEARIESEKEAWYRWVLRTYPEFLAISDAGVDLDELRAMLDDPDKTREQLVEKVWEGVGKLSDWSEQIDGFAKEVEAVKDNPAELKKLCISQFFKNAATRETLEHAQKYLDRYENTDGMLLVEIIDMIVHDERATKSSQPQRDIHRKRLDELRRAKTALEQNRVQAKARRQEAASAVAEELYDLPPCAHCGQPVDPIRPFSCTTCMAMVMLGSPQKLTVWCSKDHFKRDFENHAEYHVCAEGENCVGDEDEDMDDSDTSMVCKQCVEEKTPFLWCSQECAFANLPRHREKKHGVTGLVTVGDLETMLLPFAELSAKTLKEKNPGVKFNPVK